MNINLPQQYCRDYCLQLLKHLNLFKLIEVAKVKPAIIM